MNQLMANDKRKNKKYEKWKKKSFFGDNGNEIVVKEVDMQWEEDYILHNKEGNSHIVGSLTRPDGWLWQYTIWLCRMEKLWNSGSLDINGTRFIEEELIFLLYQ